MKKFIINVLLLSVFLSACAGPRKVNNSLYSTRVCLRDRQYDTEQNYTIAVWINENSTNRNLAEVESLKIKQNRTLVFTETNLNRNCYNNSQGGLAYFYQYLVRDTNQLTAAVELELNSPGNKTSYFHSSLKKIEGRPLISTFEKGPHLLKKGKGRLDFENLEKGYIYELSIYGPEGRLAYQKKLSPSDATLSLDLKGLSSGTNLIGIYKMDNLDNMNMISREYSVVLE